MSTYSRQTRNITDSQKAYRKLAVSRIHASRPLLTALQLVNHPDKNPHRIEEATKIFADLQQAYEVRAGS